MNLAWPSAASYSNLILSPKGKDDLHQLSEDEACKVLAGEDVKCHDYTAEGQQKAGIYSDIMSNDRIRLFYLSPGQENSPTHGRIAPACLRNSSIPAYEALSYTWADESGDSTRRYPVFIGPYWDIVYVTHNCAEVLRSVRHPQADRIVWIDSLCINQDSADEKNQQVRLVREIYQTASTVIVYLGHASADSDFALSAIKAAASREPWRSGDLESTNPGSRAALQSLFQRPYFSRVWVVQEVLHAQHLTIICGKSSVSLRNQLSIWAHLGSSAPQWLVSQGPWSRPVAGDILQSLHNVSSHECSDPRDMVFGVLGLIHGSDLYPDYRLPVESVYTGIAAYILQNHFAFEVLALSGIGKKKLNIPSWVPDWSQHPVKRFPSLFPSRGELEDMTDIVLESATPFVFDAMIDTELKIQIDVNTGSLQTHAVNLCDISGEITRVGDKTHITISKGLQGILVISLLDSMYQAENDSLFLLNGWSNPVILRRVDANSYLLVSACALFFEPPSSKIWLNPMPDPIENSETSEFKVSRFSPDEKDLIQALHSRFDELCAVVQSSPVPFGVARARVLDHARLHLTVLRDIESRLRSVWNELDQNLGWMFRDPVAVRRLVHDIAQGNQSEYSGEGETELDIRGRREFVQYCGVEFPTVYRWDLRRFCSSFIQQNGAEYTALDNDTWTPIFPQLKAQLPEIRRWAETTEQLLRVFEYSRIILSKSWSFIPGAHLPDKWLQQQQLYGFAVAPGAGIQEVDTSQLHDNIWDWSEFRASMGVRQLLWDERLPHLLDPSVSYSMAAHLGLRSLGLDLDSQVTIKIV